MDKLKQWVALTLVGVLAVLAAGWFLLIAPKRSDAEAISAETATQDTRNASLRTALAVLKAQAKAEPAQVAKLAAISAKIPDNPALPALIRNLDKISASTGVDLISLSPSPPSSIAAPVAPATPVAPGGTPVAAGQPAVSAASGTLQSIGVSLTINGSYFQALEFIDGLEGLSRAFKVTGLTVTPAPAQATTNARPLAKNAVAMTVTGTVFLAAGATPLAPVTVPKPGK
jgi:Tfp pilus assembly protein PilO